MKYNCQALVKLRKVLELDQQDMANILKISRTAYSNRERGKINFKISEMELIANNFSERLKRKVTISDLFFID